MIKKIFLTLIIGIILILPLNSAQFALADTEQLNSSDFSFNLNAITHESIVNDKATRLEWMNNGLNYFLEKIITLMATLIGSISVLMASVGGFMILFSAGDQSAYEKGVNIVKYSLIGLAVTLGAYVLVTSVQFLIKSIW